MTLSNDQVLAALNRHFVCAWKNIKGANAWVGTSNTHLPANPAIEVTNCAGHHNVQMFFLTSDGRVLHGLPGYWNPRHFVEELGAGDRPREALLPEGRLGGGEERDLP